MNKKALVLVSGGLDSAVAIGVMQQQQVALEGVCFLSYFSDGIKEGKMGYWARTVCDHFGIKLHCIFLRQEFVDMIRKAPHGYGVGLNPCIDCKILMLKKAQELMKKIGASFLVTGEVLGERPMSQHKSALDIIARSTGIEGYILRPLSGKLLPQTEPEKAGIIDRDKLGAIQGRSRSEQMRLAREFGLKKYPTPAGGCVLADKIFAKRMNDLFHYGVSHEKRYLTLRWGRHFRLTDEVKVVLGRDDKENKTLVTLAADDDYVLALAERTGPIGFIQGPLSDAVLQRAALLVKYFSKAREEKGVTVEYWQKGDNKKKSITVDTITPDEVQEIDIR